MDETLDILVIAPAAPGLPPLAWWSEFNQLAEIQGVDLTPLGSNRATLTQVAQALRQRRDIVIWSGHGQANSLILADGETIDGEWLATQARCGAPRVVLLMACLSAARDADLESLAGEISRVGINAVAMQVQVDDRAASVYTIEFVRALAAGADIGQADRVASKRMARACPDAAQGVILVPGLTNGYRFINDRLDTFDRRLTAIESQLARIAEQTANATYPTPHLGPPQVGAGVPFQPPRR